MSSLGSVRVVLFACAVYVRVTAGCYWNAKCPYQLYSTKTPYDVIRGDIRDYIVPQNCEAVGIWTLNRHGNRNPDKKVTKAIKYIASLKDEIVASYDAGRSQLCAQDAENFRRWTWNDTLDITQFSLTETGYEEIFGIAKRLREKYPYLLRGSNDDYYIRSTIDLETSAGAFADGLTEGTNLTVTPDKVRTRDDVIGPSVNCERYHETVERSQLLHNIMEAYFKSPAYIGVQNAVQQRLGITTLLSTANIYTLFELCRFDRSWSQVHQSPWCAAFSDHDLLLLEYKDDVRHYYKNGYGSWVNVKLGGTALKDLYENFEASVNGRGKKVTSYFVHNTMFEMTQSAMGLFKDEHHLEATELDPNRLWRTSMKGAFSANFVAVLNRCDESGSQSYRVQLFINEKKTELCPLKGCTWQQFQDRFHVFKSVDLDFCSMEYRLPEPELEGNSQPRLASNTTNTIRITF